MQGLKKFLLFNPCTAIYDFALALQPQKQRPPKHTDRRLTGIVEYPARHADATEEEPHPFCRRSPVTLSELKFRTVKRRAVRRNEYNAISLQLNAVSRIELLA